MKRRTGKCPFCERRHRLTVKGRLGQHTVPDPDPLLVNYCLGSGREPVVGTVQ